MVKCSSGAHRHPLKCRRCERVNDTVALTQTESGVHFGPTCSDCSAYYVRRGLLPPARPRVAPRV